MKLHVLHPAKFKLDGGAMYGIIPKPLWEKKSPPDELNRIDLDLRVALIQTNKRNILIDTGIGFYREDKWNQRFDVQSQPDALNSCLAKINLKSSDITDVVLTHLHFDHVGGLGNDKNPQTIPLFENARLHIHRDHYIYALNPSARDSGSFQKEYFEPLINFYRDKNLLILHEGMEGDLFEGLCFKCSHGHTPFMMHPYNEQFIYMADLVPTIHHLPIAWVMGYDIAAAQTTRDKENFYPFIAEKKLTLIFEHDPDNVGCNIDKSGKILSTISKQPKKLQTVF